jgi:hypothetical protein
VPDRAEDVDAYIPEGSSVENRADGATRFASVVRPMKLFDGFD